LDFIAFFSLRLLIIIKIQIEFIIINQFEFIINPFLNFVYF